MKFERLTALGLNLNEAKVYAELCRLTRCSASDIVKSLGVHRNIVYDNLEKLREKGFLSFVVEGGKRIYFAEAPIAIVDFLSAEKEKISEKIEYAETLIPEIEKLIGTREQDQDAYVFRGVQAVKKLLYETLKSTEFWVIGISNDSVRILGRTFWKNFNVKRRHKKAKENLLINHDFKDVVNLEQEKFAKHRILPEELTQPTEMILHSGTVNIYVYTEIPHAIKIESQELFTTYRKHFDFLWKLSRIR